MAYLLLHAIVPVLLKAAGVYTGFVIVTYRQGSKTGYVETLDVDPHYAKMGIGLKLLTSAETDMGRQENNGRNWKSRKETKSR